MFLSQSNRLFNRSELSDNKELELLKLLEREFYDEILNRIYAHPRYYLDNLEQLDVFLVSFNNYNPKVYK